VTASGPQELPIAYHVHRGLLIGIMLAFTFGTGYLVFRGLPDLQLWVLSAIQAVRDEWASWDWDLL
jgi:hypothetical protein